jgi:hypothetical protein
MAQQSPTVQDNKAGATGQAPLTPPDEQFWVRYSPHHEFPLSSISSVALHLLLILLVFLAIWVASFVWHEDPRSVPVDAVVVEETGGGGGNPDGKGKGPGDGGAPPEEAVEKKQDPDQPVTNLPKELNIPRDVDPLDIPTFSNDKGDRQAAIPEVMRSLAKLDKEVRQKLFVAAGEGKGGTGKDGGTGTGKDTGQDSGTGPGKGTLTRTQQRMLRWTMIFNTNDGKDYARQLSDLGAIVAYQDPADTNEYLVLEDLTGNAKAARQDITQIKRIFWVDDKGSSVASLAGALKVPKPEFFAMFFPSSLETQLNKLEMEAANQKRRGATEDQINWTRFKVVNAGGKYQVQVEELELKRR